jgi:endonuclease G
MKSMTRWTALALLLVAGCTPPSESSKAPPANIGGASGDRNTRLGLPAPASPEPSNREAYLVVHPQYTLSYSAKKLIPNWVCWQLRKDDIGQAERGAFEPDPLIPSSFPKVTSHAYDGSGFDRGHMCPAQDRSASQADMDATFVTSNVIPQSPMCNQRGWERLESYCRDLTKKGNVLQICCGPVGVGGEGKNGPRREIGKGNVSVVVPAKVWKVILVLPADGAEATAKTRAIAVMMPNDQSVDYDWSKFRVSVQEIEQATGLTFWPALPGEVTAVIKSKVDDVRVHVPIAAR